MSGPRRLGRQQLQRLSAALSDRDWAVLHSVASLHFARATQLQRLHFAEHASPLSAARISRRVLERLTQDRLLRRLERRIGGVRAGSASYVYTLGPTGQRLLDTANRSRKEPSLNFLDHTLAIAELVVQIYEAVRSGQCELLSLQVEPTCWRQTSHLGSREVLKPDLFLSLGVGTYEYRWFVEVDMGTGSCPAILRKCACYQRYYDSGTEQEASGVFPRIIWLVKSERRQRQLVEAIEGDRTLMPALFAVALQDEAVAVLAPVSALTSIDI